MRSPPNASRYSDSLYSIGIGTPAGADDVGTASVTKDDDDVDAN